MTKSFEGSQYIGFPLAIDWTGRAAEVDRKTYIAGLVEQLLLVSPSERVNRMTLGSGVGNLVFKPGNELAAESTRIAAEAALQQWLGDLIELVSVDVLATDSTLEVTVAYIVRESGDPDQVQFERKL